MSSIDTRFAEFHAANPHVYAQLVSLARQAHRRGYRRIGIELLFSALRWRSMMRTTADEYGFKLNDHFTSRYARLIMAREPDLVGLFALRTLRAPTGTTDGNQHAHHRPQEAEMTDPTPVPNPDPQPDPGNTDPSELVEDLDPDDDVYDRISGLDLPDSDRPEQGQ